jgi:ring-1,2-phenylacetyl-CoA epoxidase subunit PaaC
MAAHDEEQPGIAAGEASAGLGNVAGSRVAPMAAPLVEYLLRIGDDRLILGHRMSEWTGHGPILEEDIATAKIALDLSVGMRRSRRLQPRR